MMGSPLSAGGVNDASGGGEWWVEENVNLNRTANGVISKASVVADALTKPRAVGVLVMIKRNGAMSVPDISRALGISHAAARYYVKALKRAGLIEGYRGIDGRKWFYGLTQFGEEVVKELLEALKKLVRKKCTGWDREGCAKAVLRPYTLADFAAEFLEKEGESKSSRPRKTLPRWY